LALKEGPISLQRRASTPRHHPAPADTRQQTRCCAAWSSLHLQCAGVEHSQCL